jgi:O-antigen/teichoic acid export membrane protein
MNNYLTDSNTRSSTAGGTLLVLILQINGAQLLDTALTAATGAVVSFAVAIGCKYIRSRLAAKYKNRKPTNQE